MVCTQTYLTDASRAVQNTWSAHCFVRSMCIIEQMESLEEKVTPSEPSGVAPEDPPIDLCIPNNTPESHQEPKAEIIPGLSDLVFEAISSKDGAWYDVASFLDHRFRSTGELEVRVRFAGYRKEEDEWVNVENGVRERSIPLEDSDCDDVNVGDLVLCFRETDEEAIYCDAHIVRIQRRLHDIRGCRCIFVVRYDDDEFEEKVQLKTMCCRPKNDGSSSSPGSRIILHSTVSV